MYDLELLYFFYIFEYFSVESNELTKRNVYHVIALNSPNQPLIYERE